MQYPTKQIVTIPKEILGCSCMLLMMHAYGFAPLLPTLTSEFRSALMPLTVPVFALSFSLSALGMAAWHRFITLRRIFIISMFCLCAGSLLLSFNRSGGTFLLTRAITGLGTGMMLPSALMLASTGRKKGSFARLIMVMFALAAGMTFGPSLGGWLNAVFGWRAYYRGIAMLVAVLIVFSYLFGEHHQPRQSGQMPHMTMLKVFRTIGRSLHIYVFTFLTAVFHSAVFVWISSYFTSKYKLDEPGIANDLMIFGLPGLVVAYLLYRFHWDAKVVKILYAGFFVVIAGLFVLMTDQPLWLAECVLGLISIGFSCTQPLFIGILKMPSTVRPIAIGSGILFAGYGFGPLAMILLLGLDMTASMVFLVILVIILAVVSRSIWRDPQISAKVAAMVREENPQPGKVQGRQSIHYSTSITKDR